MRSRCGILMVLVATGCGGGGSDATSDPQNHGGDGMSAADGGASSKEWGGQSDGGPEVTGTGLFNDYRASSPHYGHVSPMYTDFYYGWTADPDPNRDWAAAHLDVVMSGTLTKWKSRNPTIKHIPYQLHWTLFQPAQPNTSDFSNMSTWYANAGLNTHAYVLEQALLHYPANAQFRDYAHATAEQIAAYKGAANDVTKLPLVTATGNGSAAERIQTHIWDSWRYVFNPADAGCSAYLRYLLGNVIAEGHDGVFYDEYGSGGMSAAYTSLELTTATYQAASVAQMAAEKSAFPNAIIMPNTAEYTAPYDVNLMSAAGHVHMEKMNNPLSGDVRGRWGTISTILASGVTVEYVSAYTWSDTLPASYVGGDYASPTLRLKMAELASYYMIRPSDASKMLLDENNFWNAPPETNWLKAEEANLGAPTAARSLMTKGTDGVGQSYEIYSRDYDRGLVVMRPVIGYATNDYGDASKVSVMLPAGESWYFLNADGTTKGPISSVDLRVAEAAIVIKGSKVTGL